MSVSLVAGQESIVSPSTTSPRVTASAAHCAFCFDIIQSNLCKTERAVWTLPFATQKLPLFVTWSKKRGKNWELRGCIGTFSRDIRIEDGLEKYACISAFQDGRFSPIEASELPHLKCSVSLLHTFTGALSWNDWKIGHHGITIEFDDDQGESYSATYLPEVAIQQGWDRWKTFSSLVRKAGYKNKELSLLSNLRVTRYQSTKFTLTFAEFRELYDRSMRAQVMKMSSRATSSSSSDLKLMYSSPLHVSTFNRDFERERDRRRDRRRRRCGEDEHDSERERDRIRELDRDHNRHSSPNTLETASALSSLFNDSLTGVGHDRRESFPTRDFDEDDDEGFSMPISSSASASCLSCSSCGSLISMDSSSSAFSDFSICRRCRIDEVDGMDERLFASSKSLWSSIRDQFTSSGSPRGQDGHRDWVDVEATRTSVNCRRESRNESGLEDAQTTVPARSN